MVKMKMARLNLEIHCHPSSAFMYVTILILLHKNVFV